jgi:hypothetical protein
VRRTECKLDTLIPAGTTLRAICRDHGAPYQRTYLRLRSGMTLEQALVSDRERGS